MVRFLDILLSILSLCFLIPILLPIALVLLCTGEHYIFYIQERIGKRGNPFGLIKFATMLKDSPNIGDGMITVKKDPRILPLGHFLRRTKINELPQLLNILKGDMSFIGPRPQVKKHYDLFTDQVKDTYNKVKPGLSGIGSIVFRNEDKILSEVEDKKKFYVETITPYKGKLEQWYVKNRSLKLYFLLVFLTICVLFSQNNLYKRILKNLPHSPKELEKFL